MPSSRIRSRLQSARGPAAAGQHTAPSPPPRLVPRPPAIAPSKRGTGSRHRTAASGQESPGTFAREESGTRRTPPVCRYPRPSDFPWVTPRLNLRRYRCWRKRANARDDQQHRGNHGDIDTQVEQGGRRKLYLTDTRDVHVRKGEVEKPRPGKHSEYAGTDCHEHAPGNPRLWRTTHALERPRHSAAKILQDDGDCREQSGHETAARLVMPAKKQVHRHEQRKRKQCTCN